MGLSFAIKYKDYFLDLEPESFLTVDWFSTLFNESEIFRGSYSYSIRLRLSERNKSILKMPHLIENRSSRLKLPVSIILFGQTWKNALLEVEFDKGSLSGNLLIDNAIVADIIRETTLPDIFSSVVNNEKIYETINIGTTSAEKATYINASTSGNEPFVFPPFLNYGWNGEFIQNSDIEINRYLPEINQYDFFSTKYLFCPQFYLSWIIKTIIKKLGFTAVGSFFEFEEINKWIVFNNSYYTTKEILTTGFEIITARHLPNITIANFFKILRNDLKLPLYFDSLTKTVHIEIPRLYLEDGHYIDIQENIVADSLKIKGGDLKKYTVKCASSDIDAVQTYFNYIESVVIGSSEANNPVELTLSAPQMNEFHSDYYDNIRLRKPIVEHLSNIYDENFSEMSAYNKKGEINKNGISFMITSYRGLLPYNSAFPTRLAPYATSDNKNALGVPQSNWISTSPFIENGWIYKICEPFYQMLSLTEDVEVDAYIPIKNFMNLNPLSKIRLKAANGVNSGLLLDKISFEPSGKNSSIFSRIKAYSINRTQLLFGSELMFRVNTKSEVPDVIYVFASFHFLRTEPAPTSGTHYFGELFIEFYSDKYKVNPKMVSNLEIRIDIIRNITTSSGNNTMTFERTYTTAENVQHHIPSEEFIYRSTSSGSAWNSDILIYEIETNRYIPGN